ncbi:hypothetical protein [Shewanella atlantica]|nr:hypothetical protein [Shewanella atlantica]
MGFTMFLNDRKYRGCDMGEGRCTIIITFAKDIGKLCECYRETYFKLERVIILDTSEHWSKSVANLTNSECNLLVSDVRLLADIYWLESYDIKIEQRNPYLESELAT